MKFESILEAVAYNAKEFPEKLCIADQKRSYTYGQFIDYVKELVCSLKTYKKEVIVIRCNQDAGYLAVKLACEALGSVFVPVEKDDFAELPAAVLFSLSRAGHHNSGREAAPVEEERLYLHIHKRQKMVKTYQL